LLIRVESATDQAAFKEKSLLIEELVKNNNLVDATGHVLDLLKQDTHPILRIFRFYLSKLATSGDVETIKSLEPYLKNVS
jgi:leucine-rich PPR motif-containing protein